MRPDATASPWLPRTITLTAALAAAACSVQTDELETTSIECTTDDEGNTTCSEDQDRPDGEDQPPGEGDLTCSGTGCVSRCEYGDDSFHCTITCQNGLTCESTCREGACEISCDCPDGGGGGECEGDSSEECCRERPDDPACNPPCPDGSTDAECYCQDHPEDPQCAPTCPDGSSDEECAYCRENPDDPQCAPRCEDGSTDLECHCQEHPEDPDCA